MYKLISIVCISILLSSCATAPRSKKDLKAKSDKIFSELDNEEKQRGIVKSEEQKQLEKEINKDKKTQDKNQIFEEMGTGKTEQVRNSPKEIFEFEETGEGTASKYERNIDAEDRAEKDALSKALKKAGTDIYYGFSDTLAQYGKTQYQFVARYLYTWSGGLATYERIEKPIISQTEDGGTKCTLKIKGKIYSKGSPDPTYELRTDLKDRNLGLDKPAYYSGDEVKLSFWSTKDTYITILDIDENQNVYLIYPNKYVKSLPIKAGDVFEIPGNSAINLKAVLPENQSETLELLHIIATKKEPLFSSEETKETLSGEYKLFSLGALKKVTQRLAKLDRSDWTMLVLPYTIKTK